jgi:glycosyltransferase involved in cell wall biosynthesis
MAGVPIVVNTCHGLWFGVESTAVAKAAVLSAEAVAAQFSHLELYQNDADRRALRRVVPPARARTVGNGVDLERFVRDEAGRRRVRSELGLDDSDVLVAGVGRMVAEKGILDFAEAAALLDGRGTFAWIGPNDPAKPDRVEDLSGNVRLLGERRDMADVYSAIDIFVLPSHREGFSRSAMEAAACGCALVLSDIRGCREIGTDGEHMRLVPPKQPAALAATIAELIDDPEARTRLGTASAARARVAFDQRAVARQSLVAYADIAQRKGLPLAADLRRRAGES